MSLSDFAKEELNKRLAELAERRAYIDACLKASRVEHDKLLNEREEVDRVIDAISQDLDATANA